MWTKIDLGLPGPEGIEARYRIDGDVVYCFVYGSDHILDWVHHFIPGAHRRELVAGADIAHLLPHTGVSRYVIGGHSLGGAIAVIIAETLKLYHCPPAKVYVYGGKRTHGACTVPVVCIRQRGDIVPFLPPWRTKYTNMITVGRWLPFWEAHKPQNYYYLMAGRGLR